MVHQLKLGRKPTHRLYNVTGEGDNTNWKPIGAAWQHQDGNGFNINCDLIPLKGRIVLRLITEKAPAEGGQQ